MVLMVLGASTFRVFGVRGLEIFIKDVAFLAIGVLSTVRLSVGEDG
jgi:hypothetical protein